MSAAMQSCMADAEDAEWKDSALAEMEWAKPEYRRSEVDWAGRCLAQLLQQRLFDTSGYDDWIAQSPS